MKNPKALRREIPPMFIVMPDGGVSWCIDATYRTRPTREFRGLAGLSMGAGGRWSTPCASRSCSRLAPLSAPPAAAVIGDFEPRKS